MPTIMKKIAPVLALALFAPFVAEILLGATPLRRIASFPPLVLLYGGGAVLIREVARRTRGGWGSILYLGTAYALVEEGLVMQTLFHPALFGAAACGGRFAGINWVWTEALAGYHMVWSVAIPIALAELCFPERRDEPWLGRLGVSVALACYTAGALAISIVFRRFVTPGFRAPAMSLIFTAVAAAALVLWTLRPWAKTAVRPLRTSHVSIPSPWLAGFVALTAAGLWLQLFLLPASLRAGPGVLLPMLVEACLAGGTYFLLHRWSESGSGWTDLHKLAVAAGALLASSAYGVHVIQDGIPFDRLGQAGCCIVALAWLATLARRIHRRASPVGYPMESTGRFPA